MWEMDSMGAWLIIAVISAILCALIASSKNRSGVGWFLLGLVFGIFALPASILIGRIEEENSGPIEDTEENKQYNQVRQLNNWRDKRFVDQVQYDRLLGNVLAGKGLPANPPTHPAKRCFKAGKQRILDYTDAEGNTSQREVEVERVTIRGIDAWCFLREDVRTFRFDRMDAVYDENGVELYRKN